MDAVQDNVQVRMFATDMAGDQRLVSLGANGFKTSVGDILQQGAWSRRVSFGLKLMT